MQKLQNQTFVNFLNLAYIKILLSSAIRHFSNEKGTGTEMRPAIVSGLVTGDAPISYWPIFYPVPSNSPRSLCKR